MKAMVLTSVKDLSKNRSPLELVDVPIPAPQAGEILIKVSVCGVCHTELDEIEGRTPPSKFPIVPGHQVVGRVAQCGKEASHFKVGERVGIAWIHSSCGTCEYCRTNQENLCDAFKATGRDADGGYAEYTTVHQNYAYRIPEVFSDAQTAPLLCAGAVGYRALKLTGMKDGDRIGLTGFGGSGHLVLMMVKYQFPKSEIFVFSRTEAEQRFAKELGAAWAGSAEEKTPKKLHAIIDTTPAWRPVVEALKNLEKGGRLVINAIRKEETDKSVLLDLNYERDLWMEKEIKSVANVTRNDVEEFLRLAAAIPIKPEIQEYRLEHANVALMELKERKIRGAKVLKIA